MSEEVTISAESTEAQAAVERPALSQEALEHLAVAIAEDPGSPHFPALAEAYRRAGQPEAAVRIARAGLERVPDSAEGELALVLALIESGGIEEATERLGTRLDGPLSHAIEQVTTQAPAPVEPTRESEEAVSATPEALDAPLLAEGAGAPPAFEGSLEDSELDVAFASAEPEADQMFDVNRVAERVLDAERLDASDAPEAGFEPEAHPSFATETMAGLLESQGDRAGAQSIREGLQPEPAPAAAPLESSGLELAWAAGQAEEQHDRASGYGAEYTPDLEIGLGAGQAIHDEVGHAVTDAGFVPEVEPEPEPAVVEVSPTGHGGRIIATLEHWLANIRREVV